MAGGYDAQLVDRVVEETSAMVKHYQPTVQRHMQQEQGDCEAKTVITVRYTEKDGELTISVTAKATLPERSALEPIKASWAAGQMKLL